MLLWLDRVRLDFEFEAGHSIHEEQQTGEEFALIRKLFCLSRAIFSICTILCDNA